MPNVDPSKPAIGLLPLIKVTWDSNEAFYCRGTQAVTVLGDDYGAVPAIDVELPVMDGSVEDKPCKIRLPADTIPFVDMVHFKGPETEVTIMEADVSDLTLTPRVVFVGTLSKVRTNWRSFNGMIEIELVGRKHFIKDVAVGIKCTDRCPLMYGDSVCGASPATVSATVSAIDGTEIEFISLPSDSTKPPWTSGRYTRGWVKVNGLKLMVRQHKVGQKKLVVSNPPPPSWVGAVATVQEGCDKTVNACKAHGREERFLGIGIAMPKYNPIYEDEG